MTREDLKKLKNLGDSLHEFVTTFEEFVSIIDEKEQTSITADQFLGLFPDPPLELFKLNKAYALKCSEITETIILQHPDSKGQL